MMRCPGCNGVYRFHVHGNGAVELRPMDDEPTTELQLPPRIANQDEKKGGRTIFTSRRRHRPIGGYMPFEKSRSYTTMFTIVAALGVGSLTAYMYFNFIGTAEEQMGKRGNNAFNGDMEVKRKAHQEKMERALKALEERKKREAPAGIPGPGRANVSSVPGKT